MTQEMKVWIRGNSERGDEVIRELVNRGGLNLGLLTGINSKKIYYICHDNWIGLAQIDFEDACIIMEEYTEIKLPPLEVKYEFEPFDNVLVIFNEYSEWKCDLFSHLTKVEYTSSSTATCSSSENAITLLHTCISGSLYQYCIPYNDKTKHLIGTNLPWDEKL